MKPSIVAVKVPARAKISISYADIYRVAVWLLSDLRDRTASGSDFKGNPFHAYSESYAEYKRKIMSNIEGSTPEKVTLMNSGKMIRSIKLNRKGNFAVAYFSLADRARIGYYHQTGAGNLPKREWMNVSMKQRREVLARLNALIKINKSNLNA